MRRRLMAAKLERVGSASSAAAAPATRGRRALDRRVEFAADTAFQSGKIKLGSKKPVVLGGGSSLTRSRSVHVDRATRGTVYAPPAAPLKKKKTPKKKTEAKVQAVAAPVLGEPETPPPLPPFPPLEKSSSPPPRRESLRQAIQKTKGVLQETRDRIAAARQFTESVRLTLPDPQAMQQEALANVQKGEAVRRMMEALLMGTPEEPVAAAAAPAAPDTPTPPETTRSAEDEEQAEAMRRFAEARAPVSPRLFLPEGPETPPEIPAAPEMLDVALVSAKFSGKNSLPRGELLRESRLPPLKGVNWSGSVPGDVLESIVSCFPGLEVISLHDSLDLPDVFCLRRLQRVKILNLWNLKQITPKMLEKMFADPPGAAAWQEIQEIHLSGMPVSDEALALIARFPRLRKLNISYCDQVSYRGLESLQERCPSLVALSLNRCPFLDPFSIAAFKEKRAQVTVHSTPHDPATLQKALAEAKARPKVQNYHPKDAAIYKAEGALIGFQTADFEFLDRVCESYRVLSRVAGALLKGWRQYGFFTNQDRLTPPQSVAEVFELLQSSMTQTMDPQRIALLDLAGSKISFLPEAILEGGPYPKLRTIKLRDTSIRELPHNFIQQCPLLELIEYPDRNQRFNLKNT